MSTIFLDESGQFAKDGNNEYFIIASFTVTDPKLTHKKFITWMHAKMPRVMRDQPEVKFSDNRINQKLRIRTLKTIISLGIKIQYVYFHKKNIPNNFKYKGQLKDGHLYLYLVEQTINRYLPINDYDLRIYCDERNLKGLNTKQFKKNIELFFLPKISSNSILQVYIAVSHDNPNIQIADWIAGALAWYHNDHPLGKACYDEIKKGLLEEGKELFKDQWTHAIKTKIPTERQDIC